MNRINYKNFFKKIVRKAGFEIHRYDKKANKNKPLPTLLENPIEALFYERRYKRVAFECPIDLTVKLNGFSYSPDRYHPFVETLKEYENGGITTYEGSLLEKFYLYHQPANACEALILFENCPDIFRTYPAHTYRLSPWEIKSAEEIDLMVKNFTKRHSLSHGEEEMSLSSDGYQYHGPVSKLKGVLEYQRLIKVYESIKEKGFDRRLGHAHFLLLKKGDSYRFLSEGSGNHRTAAMSVLGYETIPAFFQHSSVIDISMVDYWPQVCNGLWSRQQAIAYFEHLFNFDSMDWAQKKGLLINNQ